MACPLPQAHTSQVGQGHQTNWKPGGCITSALAIALGEYKDPGITMSAALLKTYLHLVLATPKQHMHLRLAWEKKLPKMRDPNHWAMVASHLDAVIATLVDNL